MGRRSIPSSRASRPLEPVRAGSMPARDRAEPCWTAFALARRLVGATVRADGSGASLARGRMRAAGAPASARPVESSSRNVLAERRGSGSVEVRNTDRRCRPRRCGGSCAGGSRSEEAQAPGRTVEGAGAPPAAAGAGPGRSGLPDGPSHRRAEADRAGVHPLGPGTREPGNDPCRSEAHVRRGHAATGIAVALRRPAPSRIRAGPPTVMAVPCRLVGTSTASIIDPGPGLYLADVRCCGRPHLGRLLGCSGRIPAKCRNCERERWCRKRDSNPRPPHYE